ncbi:hypothetical protein GCM10009007_03000 [Formosimonas limnophila]|uniref:Uncharacterized protein n=1 Tax=Formosimonas limnophila TaxID=1384487 RepID=A0A8J3CLJ8_9BURK|nr:hypothetical protein [Formosimonas limnophila]GHA65961.1 hypothetical protein GCM10009007_03000 [Formosimonas limnophila]
MLRRLNDKVRDFIKQELTQVPPSHCDLKVGDGVTFTNENGVKFDDCVVIGFSDQHGYGRTVHILSAEHDDAYWFPNKPEELKKNGKRTLFDNHLGFTNGERYVV